MPTHDYVFWCGDFNYRINMERSEVVDLVKKEVIHIIEEDGNQSAYHPFLSPLVLIYGFSSAAFIYTY